jgi:hypothetical protein
MEMQYRQLTQDELRFCLTPIGPTSKDTIQLSTVDAKATMTMHVSEQALPSLIYTILGDTIGGYPGGSAGFGKLNRVPPLAHAYMPWLYATAISGISGQAYVMCDQFEGKNGNGTLIASSDLKQKTAPLWPRYREYVVNSEYSQRSYLVATDDQITNTDEVDFFLPQNTDSTKPNKASIPVWNEWKRFCTKTYEIEGQFLSAEMGQYVMWSNNANVQGLPAGKGNVHQLRPGAKVVYTWYGVPYEWLTGPDVTKVFGPPAGFSILDLAQGTVNQTSFDNWPAGTLLYVGAKTKQIYNRPFPPITASNTLTPSRLCDLELMFIYRDPRRRNEDKDPVAGLKSRGAFIPRGNNLVPNARDGYWYPAMYTSAQVKIGGPLISTTNGTPSLYPSFPHQLLFQDPAYTYQQIGSLLV